jgi:hypothetical protein
LILAEDDFAFRGAVTGGDMAELQSCLHEKMYRAPTSGTDAERSKVDQHSWLVAGWACAMMIAS